LSRQKALWIKSSLTAIYKRFGTLSLDSASTWTDTDLEQFLCSLPGISLKSAKCIMMYSMGRKVLPVDTHVRRVATRIGLIEPDLSEKHIHRRLEALVRPDDRYAFHVNMICHGRHICTARAPRCESCIIQNYCAYGRRRRERLRPVTAAHSSMHVSHSAIAAAN
jgi:endonuclease III